MLDTVIRGGAIVDGTGASAFSGDIGIRDGTIVEVGKITETAGRTVDADGLTVTPGFLDIHTHYDGQATWDPLLEPSFSSGITTAVMGNCGVGFAPVRPGDEHHLLDLMEGVEEIPGTALSAGMKWNWSSFPEYLDVLDSMPRAFDIAALVPHGPLRRYVMGDRAGGDKCARGEDLAEMAALLDEALASGAIGLASSRTPLHRTMRGNMTDDFQVDKPELLALANVVAKHNRIFQVAPVGVGGEDVEGLVAEMKLMDEIVRDSGATMHILTFQLPNAPHYWREQLAWMERTNREGRGKAFAQIGGRAIGAILTFFGANPFMDRPTFEHIRRLPRDKWLETLAQPEIRARLISEEDRPNGAAEYMRQFFENYYDLGPGMDYEPDASMKIVNMARERNVDPTELIYDILLESADKPRLYLPFVSYTEGNFDQLREALHDPSVVLGASDAGAHVQTLCDASMHSFMLSHWCRDRTRGARLSLEFIVNLMTKRCADSVGLLDRGVIRPGLKADMNIFDLKDICVNPPALFHDLPDGSMRMMQKVTGYRMTMVSGVVTRENDQPTGALPGRLARPSMNGAALNF